MWPRLWEFKDRDLVDILLQNSSAVRSTCCTDPLSFVIGGCDDDPDRKRPFTAESEEELEMWLKAFEQQLIDIGKSFQEWKCLNGKWDFLRILFVPKCSQNRETLLQWKNSEEKQKILTTSYKFLKDSGCSNSWNVPNCVEFNFDCLKSLRLLKDLCLYPCYRYLMCLLGKPLKSMNSFTFNALSLVMNEREWVVSFHVQKAIIR